MFRHMKYHPPLTHQSMGQGLGILEPAAPIVDTNALRLTENLLTSKTSLINFNSASRTTRHGLVQIAGSKMYNLYL